MQTKKSGNPWLIVCVCGCFACGPASDRTVEQSQKIQTTLPEGTWILSNYFDSAVRHKTIAAYSFQYAVWDAVVLEFKNDSLYTYGSIYNCHRFKLNTQSDTLSVIHSDVSGVSWWLIRKDSVLVLSQIPGKQEKQSVHYTYRKNYDMELAANINRNTLEETVETYFSNKILEGTYHTKSGEVIFHENGVLKGIKRYDRYAIDEYFGTYHPYKKLDKVMFMNSNTHERKPYNWVISGDELILTEFIPDETGDRYLLGKEKMILKTR